MEDTEGAARRDADDRALLLGAFAVLLACALVLHVLWWHGVVVRSPWLVVVEIAVWVLARPTSVPRLAVLLTTAAVAIVLELPELGTHLLLVLAVAVCVLVHLLIEVGRGRGLPSAAALFTALAPFLRGLTVVLYVAAVFSKLNHGYFDPATSPAAGLSAKVVWFDPTLIGDWRVRPAIWSSVLVEASLPVLLLMRRTRPLGLVVGLVFHAVLGLSGTVPFTALLLALYVAFLPEDAPSRVRALVGGGSSRFPSSVGDATPRLPSSVGDATHPLPSLVVGAPAAPHPSGAPRIRWAPWARGPRMTTGAGEAAFRRGDVVAAATVAVWVAVGLLWSIEPGRVTDGVLASATRVLVATASVAGLAFLGTMSGGPHCRQVPVNTRATSPVFAAGLVALIACAATPYLGLRVGDAFTMYSGLRTGAGSWNHLFVPEAVRIFR